MKLPHVEEGDRRFVVTVSFSTIAGLLVGIQSKSSLSQQLSSQIYIIYAVFIRSLGSYKKLNRTKFVPNSPSVHEV
jgi:hypothetical protein